MSNPTEVWNGFETILTSELGVGQFTEMFVESIPIELDGIDRPMYLVVEPDKPTQREWIRIEDIDATLNKFLTITRGLAGGTNDIAHPPNSIVRSITTRQLIQDIFGDIAADEAALVAHATDPGDPHSLALYLKLDTANNLYVNKTGDEMGGFLTLFAAPTDDLHAATKLYVDTAIGGLPPSFDGDHANLSNVLPDQHHTRYTDNDAQGAMGTLGDINPFHHDKFTDTDAKDAMGVEDDANPFNHVKTPAGIPEAPQDGQIYGRRDGAWHAAGADYYNKSEIDAMLDSYYTLNSDPRAIAGRRLYIQSGDPGAIANGDVWHQTP